MEDLETDISYLLGCYIGLARKIELELDRLTKTQTPSVIEEYLDEFLVNPVHGLKLCQETILQDQIVLKKVNKPELIEESGEILKKINVDALEYITINVPNFSVGYHSKIPT